MKCHSVFSPTWIEVHSWLMIEYHNKNSACLTSILDYIFVQFYLLRHAQIWVIQVQLWSGACKAVLLRFEHFVLTYIPMWNKMSLTNYVRNREWVTWSGLCSKGQLSQWSPTPSWSVSLWSTLYTYGQLSFSFRIPEQRIVSLARVSLDSSLLCIC